MPFPKMSKPAPSPSSNTAPPSNDPSCKPRSNGSSYGLFFLEYSLLAEYNLLQRQRIPGVYVTPASTTPLCNTNIIL